jgi:hypothetical protein
MIGLLDLTSPLIILSNHVFFINLIFLKSIGWLLHMIDLNFIVHMVGSKTNILNLNEV